MHWLIPPALLAGHSAGVTEVFVLLTTVVILGVIRWLVPVPVARWLRRLGLVVWVVALAGAALTLALIVGHHQGCYGPPVPVQEDAWRATVAELPSCSDTKALAGLTHAYQAEVILSIFKHLLIIGLLAKSSAWVVKQAGKTKRPALTMLLVIAASLLAGAACTVVALLQV